MYLIKLQREAIHPKKEDNVFNSIGASLGMGEETVMTFFKKKGKQQNRQFPTLH